MVAQLQADKKTLALKSDLLTDLISAFAETRHDWDRVRQLPKYAECPDIVDHLYSRDIHSLVMKLRNKDQVLYKRLLAQHEAKYPNLRRCKQCVLQMLASAEMLIESRLFSPDPIENGPQYHEPPIYSGPVVEIAKAIEVALNYFLIQPFQLKQEFAKPAIYSIKCMDAKGEQTEVEMIGKKTLGAIELILNSPDENWLHFFCNHRFGETRLWLKETMPGILRVIRREYRNDAAHSRMTTREEAGALLERVRQQGVFERFEHLASMKINAFLASRNAHKRDGGDETGLNKLF